MGNMENENFLDVFDSLDLSKTADWTAGIHHRDPLEDPATSPTVPVPQWERRGRSLGRTLGTIGGGLAGLAMPLAMGYNIGHMGVEGAAGVGNELAGVDPAQHPGLIGAEHGAATGAGVGLGAALAPHALWTTPVGAGIGHEMGGDVGQWLGRKMEGMYSPQRRAVEQIRRMSPAKGLAYYRTLEQTGQASPESLEAMREAYNRRRDTIRDQVGAHQAMHPLGAV